MLDGARRVGVCAKESVTLLQWRIATSAGYLERVSANLRLFYFVTASFFTSEGLWRRLIPRGKQG